MNKPTIQIGENALQAIKQKKISPRPKWQCLLSGKIAWVLSFIFVVVGSLAFSVVLYMIRNNDWDLYAHSRGSLAEFVLATLPYFWIAMLLVLGYLALFSSKFTSKGYRFKLSTLLLVGLSVNIALGSVFYQAGLGQLIDTRLQAEVPAYNYLSVNKEKIWTQPDKGVLSGIIESSAGDRLTLRDYLGNIWTVDLSAGPLVKGRTRLEVGIKIKIIGNRTGNNEFLAQEIRPWQGRGPASQRGAQGY